MTTVRVRDVAFAISGVSTAVSTLATGVLSEPDLPGFVLVITGGSAWLLSRGQRGMWEYRILKTLVVLTASIVGLHQLWHRLGASHDWLEPLYVGAIIIYAVVAISTLRRLFDARANLPPA